MANTRVSVIDWKLIGACNLRCLHCYGPPKNEFSLPLEKLLKIIEIFHKIQPEWVVMTGGEPLLVPNIGILFQKLNEAGIKIALSTNTHFFRKHQKNIEKYVSSLNIPLDGSTPGIHAKSRKDEKSFHTFFDVLNNYLQNPDEKPELLRVGTVYSAANRNDFCSIASRLEPYETVIDTWKIYEIIDYEFQPTERAPLLLESGSFKKDMQNLLEKTAFKNKIMLAPRNLRNKAYFLVNPRGEAVLPTEINSRTVEQQIGSLFQENLETILERWEQKIEQMHYREVHEHYRKRTK